MIFLEIISKALVILFFFLENDVLLSKTKLFRININK
jgi:hypothetical protein